MRRATDVNYNYWVTQAANGRGPVLETIMAMSAFTEQAGALYREIYWLVSDQLNTPPDS